MSRDLALEPIPRDPVAATAAKASWLRRLELLVTRRLDGLLSGEMLSARPGPGTEPAGARLYSPGDDARHIDWSLTARMVEPYVRITDADRELETWVVADRSSSLDFGTTVREKREVVLAAVAAFGFLDLRGANRFGVVVAGGERLIHHQAGATRTAVMAALARLYDSPRREEAPGAGADLTGALTYLEKIHRRRGRVIIVSDFLEVDVQGDADPPWLAPMRRLASRHQVVAVQVIDPRELALPAIGIVRLVDTETGRHLHVQTDSPKLRERYAAAAAARQANIERAIRRGGVEHLVLSTERDWLLDIVRFVAKRRRTTHRAAALAGGAS